jgi:hypothetical protein
MVSLAVRTRDAEELVRAPVAVVVGGLDGATRDPADLRRFSRGRRTPPPTAFDVSPPPTRLWSSVEGKAITGLVGAPGHGSDVRPPPKTSVKRGGWWLSHHRDERSAPMRGTDPRTRPD